MPKKVQQGEPFRPSAADHNAFVSAAEYVDMLRHSSAVPPAGAMPGTTIVPMRNDSGSDLDRFSVLGIDGVFPTAADDEGAFKAGPTLLGIVPDRGVHCGNFAVLLEPADAGGIAPACIEGLCVAKLQNPAYAYHTGTTSASRSESFWRSAEIADGETSCLVAHPVGSAQVLWRPDAAGEQWALVRIGGAARRIWAQAWIDEQEVTAGDKVAYWETRQAQQMRLGTLAGGNPASWPWCFNLPAGGIYQFCFNLEVVSKNTIASNRMTVAAFQVFLDDAPTPHMADLQRHIYTYTDDWGGTINQYVGNSLSVSGFVYVPPQGSLSDVELDIRCIDVQQNGISEGGIRIKGAAWVLKIAENREPCLDLT